MHAILPVLLVVMAAPVAAAPRVIWHTDSVRHDQTVMAFGDGFTPGETRCVLVALADSPADEMPGLSAGEPLPTVPPEDATLRDAVFVTPERAGVPLPPRREDDRMYLVWFGQPGEWSRPLVVNRPAVTLLTPDPVAPGGQLQVFGRTLGSWPRYNPDRRRYEEHSWVVFLDAEDNVAAAVHGYAGSNYELEITVPEDLAPGDYTVRVHSTRGTAHGWSDPVELTVREPEPWPTHEADARDSGVVGDGVTDDTAALQAALDDCAEAGGGVVRLPAGTFLISETLDMPPMVWLRGAGMESTRIQFDTEVPFIAGRQKPVIAGRTRFRLTDLSVLSGPATVRGLLISNPDGPAEGILIQRCRFKALVDQDRPWNQAVLFNLPWSTPRHPVVDSEISDCVIEAAYSLFLTSARRVRVLRNTLLHTHMPIGCWSMAECLVEGNRFVPAAHGERSQHGPMLMASAGHFGGVVRNVFRLNSGGHHGPRVTGPRNVGEAFAFDCLGNVETAVYRGAVAEAGETRVTLTDADFDPGALRDMTAFIISGPGVGQVRVVTDNTADTATLDRPWHILPDETSMITITRSFRENMLVRNEFFNASSCFIWGRGFHNLFALNQFEDVGFVGAVGISWHTEDRSNPCFFNEFSNNWLTYRSRPGRGIGVRSGDYRDLYEEPLPEPLVVGTIVRGNEIRGAEVGLTVAVGARDQFRHPGPRVFDTLFEGNTLVGCEVGAHISERAGRTMLRSNTMEDVGEPLEDSGTDTVALEE